MKTECAEIRPPFVLEPLDYGKVRVCLYVNQEEIVREEGTFYGYDRYTIETVDRPMLSEYISANIDAWIAKAKQQEYDDLSAAVRKKRNALIAETDYLLEADYPITKDKKNAWSAYRQALRDISAQSGFPYEIVWPTKPEN